MITQRNSRPGFVACFFLVLCMAATIGHVRAVTGTNVSTSASLHFDSAIGPTTKTIVRNSGALVTFAWTTSGLPSDATCRIYLRPNDLYQALASPAGGGTRTSTTINSWGTGTHVFYLRCSNGTASNDITLTIQPPVVMFALTINNIRAGTGTVAIPGGTPAVASCTSFPCVRQIAGSTMLTLSATASGTSVFTGWSGACSGIGATCNVTMNAATTVNVAFSDLDGGATAITAGIDHSCALTGLGGVKCWGDGNYGALGDGGRDSHSSPIAVYGLSSGVQAISASNYSTCALTTQGAVKCWGWNEYGQLGNGGTIDGLTPQNVAGLDGGVQAITSSGTHACALTQAGAVKCWGAGPLGNGNANDSSSPVDVVGLASGVRAIAAGYGHTCALTDAGAVKCWGYNSHGQLGDGSTEDRLTPVNVVGLESGIRAITAGGAHTCALTETGAAQCWGSNSWGQLGDSSLIDSPNPVAVSSLGSGLRAISAGYGDTCAITAAGSLKCWGLNDSGELGDGSTVNRPTPVDVSGLDSGVAAISAGYNQTCAVTEAGAALCWGDNHHLQIGNGYPGYRATPVNVFGLGSNIQGISSGYFHGCALTATGAAKCWGSNQSGVLGDGSETDRPIPVDVSNLSGGVRQVVAGGLHSCAITLAGAIRCWGRNSNGELGDGSTTHRTTPSVEVAGLGSNVQAIALGKVHTCALAESGAVLCWGDNSYGQLGDGSRIEHHLPVNVTDLAGGVRAISGGDGHTCALTVAGAVRCWGRNGLGQLGDGTREDRLVPVAVVGLDSGVRAISAGGVHTCALTETGAVKCWGYNSFGQLGDGSTATRLTPITVSGLDSGASLVVAGFMHTCAAMATGGAKCWGENISGQLGDGSAENRLMPVAVSGLGSRVQMITAGYFHTCALTQAGAAVCWGDDYYGQLGDGGSYNLTPDGVIGLGGF